MGLVLAMVVFAGQHLHQNHNLRRLRGGLGQDRLDPQLADAFGLHGSQGRGMAQDIGATFVRTPDAVVRPYVDVQLSGTAPNMQLLMQDLRITSILILVGALFEYKLVWKPKRLQQLKPALARSLFTLLLANALRVVIVNIFVPLTAAGRAAYHADSDWWYSKVGTVHQMATDSGHSLDLFMMLRKVLMTWTFTQGIADIINEAPEAIRDTYVAATR